MTDLIQCCCGLQAGMFHSGSLPYKSVALTIASWLLHHTLSDLHLYGKKRRYHGGLLFALFQTLLFAHMALSVITGAQ
ncbi:hypothetical protein NPIL_76591 [Nephila pilipes]|uniref:Uncharacterized protein n=1 Tax=Nephila pilipes TaxID=299642 RepID=A0A8X6UNM9_NEPPI|nr:hypothetical protein NPIL_76591 [Nephila pilipes]